MHELINKLAFSLFRKNSLEQCTVEEIEHLAKQHPYFSSAQLLLAAKQKETNHPDFEKQLVSTSLHVNNSLWLEYLLNRKPAEKIVVDEKIITTEVDEEPNNDELVLERTKHEFVVASQPDEKMTSSPALHVIEKVEATDQALVFEPYYTVDYFASQGIKNILEERPKDRLGQQLKSFTEWLKTIRQMPPQQIAAMNDTSSEEKVVQLATHSLAEENVDTEAMAEVWIKQGEPEKALRIYQKLSLLNPSKSSYFAVLIENIKRT